jgi:hypothetical protein
VLKLDMDKVLLSKGYCGDNSEGTLSFFICLEKGLTHTFINHQFYCRTGKNHSFFPVSPQK